MEHEAFQDWLAEADRLSPRRRDEAARVLAKPAFLVAVLALLEARIDESRRCPHCAVEGAVIRGRSNGLRRYCCKGCGKTFNALTGTPLARLRKMELWAAFALGLGEGDTVKGGAGRCEVAGTTSFRCRHHFLATVKAGAIKLKGIVEADETYVLASRKGARKLDRKAGERRRGELHLNTVNSRHERLKTFLRGSRGVATKYLDSSPAWHHLAILPKLPTSRSVLASVAGVTPVGQPQSMSTAS